MSSYVDWVKLHLAAGIPIGHLSAAAAEAYAAGASPTEIRTAAERDKRERERAAMEHEQKVKDLIAETKEVLKLKGNGARERQARKEAAELLKNLHSIGCPPATRAFASPKPEVYDPEVFRLLRELAAAMGR